MKRELIIDGYGTGIRSALLEDGRLCEIHTEKQAESSLTETLFYGRVQSVRTSLHAAFVDIGQEKNAFLPLDEGQKLRGGDYLIVQGAAQQTTDSKGLRISADINLAGKWLVLTPGKEGIRVSKKVHDEKLRQDLTALGQEICPPDCGLIIRTAGEDGTAERMKEEAMQLFERWQDVQNRAKGLVKLGILLAPEPLFLKLARDIRSVSSVVVNDSHLFDVLVSAKNDGKLEADTQLLYYKEESTLIFDAFGVEAQIDKALKSRVWLPCGGYLIIDFTEALTVIDVNSGKMIAGKDAEGAALKINLEAVDEAARQLRLRDVGGIVVIDLIDMAQEANRRTVIEHMKKIVQNDRSPVKVEGITKLGLLEMSRKRSGVQLRKALRNVCSYCSGSGEVFSGEEVARRALYQVRRMALAGQCATFVIELHPNAAKYLADMCIPQGVSAFVLPVQACHMERFHIIQQVQGETIPPGAFRLRQTAQLPSI